MWWAGGLICVLWFGARLVVEGKLSPGELSTFVIYSVYVGSNVGSLAGVVASLVQVRPYPLYPRWLLTSLNLVLGVEELLRCRLAINLPTDHGS